MKIVVAPNAFKGSLSATQAAMAMARGVREAMPDAEVVQIPVADGGDGTVEALVEGKAGEYRGARVEGPLGDPVEARYGLVDSGRTAVIELAKASGLALIEEDRLDPWRASTFGFGQLLAAARADGVKEVVAGIGGSATNEGGAGMAQALGYRLLAPGGRDIDPGARGLAMLDRIITAGFDPAWKDVKVRVACDVTNPLTGPNGATYVYGPQKGADAGSLKALDRALEHFAEIIQRDLGKSVANVPGSGAAGGTGAGLIAFLGAELVSGAGLIVEAAGLDKALVGADLVITGEGRIDGQTAFGKAPGEVARRAKRAGVPVLVVAGMKGAGWDQLTPIGISRVFTLVDEEGSDGGPGGQNLAVLMQNAEQALAHVTAKALKAGSW
jgi:glycerate 2-kinase